MRHWYLLLFLTLFFSCHTSRQAAETQPTTSQLPSRKAVVSFAKKQLRVPYKYGGNTPKEGFDCSGFINYVYGHFGVQLPRTSAAQANYGRSISLKKAKPGDLIFFTGKDARSGKVGHAGIITHAAGDQTEFIHAASNGVVVSLLSETYYRQRLIKVTNFLRR